MAREAGLEPATVRLTGDCTTIVLHPINAISIRMAALKHSATAAVKTMVQHTRLELVSPR